MMLIVTSVDADGMADGDAETARPTKEPHSESTQILAAKNADFRRLHLL